jgi:hypothetical protein
VLRRIFGPKRKDVAGGCGKLHSVELHSLYFSPNIIRVIELMTFRWAGHVTYMGERDNAYWLQFWSKYLRGRDHMENVIVHG